MTYPDDEMRRRERRENLIAGLVTVLFIGFWVAFWTCKWWRFYGWH
jgi:hypothetical protein